MKKTTSPASHCRRKVPPCASPSRIQCPPLPSKKKPDAKKTTSGTETAGTEAGSASKPGSSSPPPSMSGDATKDADDWLQTMWDNAEEKAARKRIEKIKKEFKHGLMPISRKASFDAGHKEHLEMPLSQATFVGNSPAGTPIFSPAEIPGVSPNNTPLPSPKPSQKGNLEGPLPDLFDDLGETNGMNAGETEPKLSSLKSGRKQLLKNFSVPGGI